MRRKKPFHDEEREREGWMQVLVTLALILAFVFCCEAARSWKQAQFDQQFYGASP